MSSQSHFTPHNLAEIFRDLYVGERVGVLKLSHEQMHKQVFFDRGLIVFAESQLADEDLGRCLVEEGKISEGALVEARENTSESGEIAQVLIQRDLVTKDALSETARNIVDRVVRSVFQWEGGTARFNEGPRAPHNLDSDVLLTFQVILRGVSDMAGFEPIADAMLGLDNKLRLASPLPVPLERMTLSPAHGFILSRVDGTTTAKEVVSTLPASEGDQGLRFLFGLLVMGVMEYEPSLFEGPFRVGSILRDHADRRALERMQENTIQEVYTKMKAQDAAETLGVPTNATRETIEQAYEEAKETFSRDRILPKVRERYRAELAVIESRLIEAYLKLTQPGADRPTEEVDPSIRGDDLLVRMEMDKTRSKLEAEKSGRVADNYFAQARKAMREGDFHNAIQYGKLAISYNGSDARYYFLLADCQVRNPGNRWQRQAEQNYARAAELDPWNVDYLLCLGRFYLKRGLKLRAKKQFEEALKIAPQHEAALEELRKMS